MRHDDQVYVIRHEAIAPDFQFRLRRAIGEELAIDLAVAVFEKNVVAAVAAMRNVVGKPRSNNACESSHEGSSQTCTLTSRKSILSETLKWLKPVRGSTLKRANL